MLINTGFSSSNIEVKQTDGKRQAELNIVNDNQSEFKQWFYFRVSNILDQTVTLSIANAHDCAYVEGWENYQACCSYDGIEWFRVATEYRDGELIITQHALNDSAYFAYFAPYSYERHLQLVDSVALHPLTRVSVIGQTLDNREMHLITVGEPSAEKKSIWIIARQHPGETMAEWFMEGLIDRLLDADDAVAQSLLERHCFYLVPNMNPDGSERGHLRTNAIGINLNREWDKATLEKSPEVHCVRQHMEQTGVDLFLDIHGDEALPYNFLAANEGIPSYNEQMAEQERHFSG
ncbi:MAG: M14-type cytosolic carboxypeptidase, partial [Kangiellaceae bacterium]|nr:M14-type cytosolic carboxypeptidase [Kangiellaceae bacterium]